MTRVIEPPIVVEVMHSHLEVVSRQFFTQLAGNRIIAFGNKVKRRMEAKSILQFHQSPAFGQSSGTLDIVGEHEREFFALRPAAPTGRWKPSFFIDGPDITAGFALTPSQGPAQRHTQTPRQVRLELVIEMIDWHQTDKRRPAKCIWARIKRSSGYKRTQH